MYQLEKAMPTVELVPESDLPQCKDNSIHPNRGPDTMLSAWIQLYASYRHP